MNKEEEREADIDAIAEVIYTAIHGNDEWPKLKNVAAERAGLARVAVRDTRLQAEHVLASHWLSVQLHDARQDGYNDGHLDGYNDGFREAQQVFS